MHESLAAVVALLLLASAPAAVAQDQKPPRMTKEQMVDRIFERFDANGDGVITREEVLAASERPDARREERRKRAEEWLARRFAALDADGDGRVTVEEFQARQGEVFARLDADGDGVITKEEFLSHWEGRKGRHHRQ